MCNHQNSQMRDLSLLYGSVDGVHLASQKFKIDLINYTRVDPLD